MSLVLAERVLETTTTTGTGTITLAGAQTGCQSFANTIGTNNTCYYTISNPRLPEWEIGLGTLTANTTLSRDTILSSSNANTKVSFSSGNKDIFVTYPASKAVVLDENDKLTIPDQTYLNSTNTTLPTIRPSLNLDFARTKSLDPRITFSRPDNLSSNTTGSATYYDGRTTAKAEENLLKGSNDFGNSAYWTPTNASTPVTGITAPDGTLTAYSFTASGENATLYQTLTTGALPYTFTIYLQLGTISGQVNLTLDGVALVPKTITSTWARYDITNSTLTAGSHTIGVTLLNA